MTLASILNDPVAHIDNAVWLCEGGAHAIAAAAYAHIEYCRHKKLPHGRWNYWALAGGALISAVVPLAHLIVPEPEQAAVSPMYGLLGTAVIVGLAIWQAWRNRQRPSSPFPTGGTHVHVWVVDSAGAQVTVTGQMIGYPREPQGPCSSGLREPLVIDADRLPQEAAKKAWREERLPPPVATAECIYGGARWCKWAAACAECRRQWGLDDGICACHQD